MCVSYSRSHSLHRHTLLFPQQDSHKIQLEITITITSRVLHTNRSSKPPIMIHTSRIRIRLCHLRIANSSTPHHSRFSPLQQDQGQRCIVSHNLFTIVLSRSLSKAGKVNGKAARRFFNFNTITKLHR